MSDDSIYSLFCLKNNLTASLLAQAENNRLSVCLFTEHSGSYMGHFRAVLKSTLVALGSVREKHQVEAYTTLFLL